MHVGGLSSGLDTNALIEKLMSVERVPLQKMQDRQKILKWRKEALQEFKGKLAALQSKATTLVFSATFNSKAVSSTDNSIVTASANTSAANTDYNVTVNGLATATKRVTAAIGLAAATKAVRVSTAELNVGAGIDANPNAVFDSGTTNLESAVNTGSFTINGVTINVDSSVDTINTVLNKINSSAAGVVATFSGDKVTLTQKTAGSVPTINLGADSSGFLAAVKIDAAGALTPGTDSGFTSKMNLVPNFDAGTNGYFTINNYTFSVNTATESVQDILNKINSSSAGVTAFYDSVSDTITLTSKETGSKTINIGSVTDTSNFLTKVKLDTSVQTLGADASFTVNGANITRDSNTFEYNGVTFTAHGTGSATVTVKQDTDKIISAVEDFVNQYNSVMDWINGKLEEKTLKSPTTDEEKKIGLLNSDYLLKQTKDNLRRMMSDPVSGVRTDMNMLALVGISTGASTGTVTGLTGKLVIDKDKLKAALEKDASAVQSLFNKGTASIVDESFAGDGATTTFNLANKYLASSPLPTVKIIDNLGVTSTLNYKATAPGAGEFSVDFINGKVTLGAAPAATDTVKISYDYYTNSGNSTGAAVRIKSEMDKILQSGGMMDARIGSSGSITKDINNLDKRIDDFEDRLAQREENLWARFTAMEKALSSMQNQSQWLAGQLAQLPGFK